MANLEDMLAKVKNCKQNKKEGRIAYHPDYVRIHNEKVEAENINIRARNEEVRRINHEIKAAEKKAFLETVNDLPEDDDSRKPQILTLATLAGKL